MCTRTKLEKLLNEYVQDDEASLAIMSLVNRYHDEGYEEGMFSSNENTRIVQEEIEDEAYMRGFKAGMTAYDLSVHD